MHSLHSLMPISLTALLFHTYALAKPLPQIEATGFDPNDANSICALSFSDPANTWRNSGASKFLDDFISSNTQDNWVNRMDQLTTLNGAQGSSNLDCTDIRASNCRGPTIPCQQFTPPSYFFIMESVATAHKMLNAMYNELTNNVLLNSLGVPKIISDFGGSGDTVTGDASVFPLLNAAFTIASGIATRSPVAAGSLNVMAGIFGVLAVTESAKAPNPTLDLNEQLITAFTAAEEAFDQAAQTIFGGAGDTSKLPGANREGPNGEKTDIAKFFANGKFLIEVSSTGSKDELLQQFINQGRNILKHRLVNTVLKSLGWFVFIKPNRTEDDCNGITGARFIDGQCFTIERNETDFVSGVRTVPMDRDMILQFDDPNAGYNIDMNKLYRNANQCQKAHPNFDGELILPPPIVVNDPNDLTYPECFFDLPVITGTPCVEVLISDSSLPSFRCN